MIDFLLRRRPFGDRRRGASAPCARAASLAGLATLGAAAVLPAGAVTAQAAYPTQADHAEANRLRMAVTSAFRSGGLRVEWADDGRAFTYRDGRTRMRYDVAARAGAPDDGDDAANGGGRRARRPARGRQYTVAWAHDSSRRAEYRNRNVVVIAADGTETVVTTDGDAATRVKNGSASWVYGEELRQNTAMWWSPDGSKLAYYRFDESPVQDYYLQLSQTRFQDSLDVEAYPKAGTDNPVVDLFVWDAATGTTTRLDIRRGGPFADTVVGYYAYNVQWAPDGSAVLVNRTNRKQDVMELTACAPADGSCRVVVREEWPASWTTNTPDMQWLEDGTRFLWASERTGFRNYYLYDLAGTLHATVTAHPFEVDGIVRVDEAANAMWYTARSGDNHMKMQLHRVRLDGSGDVRLTDPALHHTLTLAPDGRHVIDVAQAHDVPPVTRLLDADGRVLDTLATSDISGFDSLGVRPAELFTFTAADDSTTLHGLLHFPPDFDPARSYPVLVSVYAGPATNGARETFAAPHPMAMYGYLVVTLDARSAGGRGKRFLDAIYRKLGQVEIDDLAAGIRQLAARPYVDGDRVGIFGTSYGGYASAMALLRHPDVFRAAAASSSVTDWRHYDTIYTERYMSTPQDNTAGYDAGSAVRLAGRLEGRLMLYYGTADNNVHPANTLQLVQALDRAGKRYDQAVGADRGHTTMRRDRMLDFFAEALAPRLAP